MKRIATFGEIMLRLSPPGRERLFQSPVLEARFGGGEANVAVSLAIFGHSARYISVVPANEIGDAAVSELRQWGVGTDFIVRRGRRLGLYYAETGSNQRPSKIIYDRENSSLAESRSGDIDWEKALDGVDWFHTTGITPAISASAAELALEAVRAAKEKNMVVSVDFNYRGKLWKYGKSAPEVMREVVGFADIGVGNEEDCQKSLGLGAPAAVEGGKLDIGVYEKLTASVLDRFPNLRMVALTLRESRSADHNLWSGILRTRRKFLVAESYQITDIVDRIGSGDAFAAGLIHGLDAFGSEEEALSFAVASSCLKHTVSGDFALITEKEVMALMKGEKSGRIQR